MTVDVEDYFQVSAFAPYIRREDWDRCECRVERNVDVILELFADAGAQATFFTLGWIAERYPQVIERIVAEGHEMASHGYEHQRVSDQSPEQFRADLRKTKSILEDIGGQEVVGYRAPSFSIGHGNLWALDVLQEEGHRYSSSIFPVSHDHYGMADAPRFAFFHKPDGLLEIPMTTIHLNGRNMPCGGGGWFRLFPYALSRWAFKRVNGVDHRPAVFYFHPWEVDPEQPRQDGLNLKTRFRHYVNLNRMQPRLSQLLKDFRWGRMDRIYLGADA
ncbi:MAG: XrtA system polysaccharide deacetylase [Gammaproteobacteria bacterium]